jgi:uncharacterized protein HemX
VAEEENEQPKIKKESVQKKSRAGLIFGIINSLLIFALAGGGYYLLQQTEDKQLAQGKEINKDGMREIESSKQLNSFQSQLAAMQSQIATFDKEIAGKDNHFTKTLAHFTETHTKEQKITRKNLMAEVSSVKRQLGKTRGDWLMADAEYLLSVANQRLQLVGDVKTTRMALEAADQRLRESGDTAAFKVREQITKEIAALRTVKKLDIVGMHASIQLLKDKVPKLAVLLPYSGKPLTESKRIHNHDEEPTNDHGVLNSALHLLEGYVTVKHTDQAVTHILTEEEVGFIRQQLGVKFEVIKIALVQQSDTIYQASIADAKQWVKSNFTINTQSISVLEELGRLSTIPLRIDFPDVSTSLKMIKDITKLRIETDKRYGQGQAKPDKAQKPIKPKPGKLPSKKQADVVKSKAVSGQAKP